MESGCGIGRWADEINGKVEHYWIIDFSENLINQAIIRFENCESKVEFKVCLGEFAFAKKIGYDNYFNSIIISGVLLYLNHEEI